MNDPSPAFPLRRTDLSAAYDEYYRSGLYDARYPRPNPALLRLVLRSIGGCPARVLDFGCGSGRYALPILAASPASVVGYDSSAEALRSLRQRGAAAIAAGRLRLADGPFEAVAETLRRDGLVDLALLAFGVLAHITGRGRRIAVLRQLAGLLAPDGRVIVTVPNGRRRFASEQRAAAALVASGQLEPGDVIYRRGSGGTPIDLTYHMFSAAEFVADLAEAGLRPLSLEPESVLAESLVTRHALAAWADTLLRRVVPLRFAYGFAAVTVPQL